MSTSIWGRRPKLTAQEVVFALARDLEERPDEVALGLKKWLDLCESTACETPIASAIRAMYFALLAARQVEDEGQISVDAATRRSFVLQSAMDALNAFRADA